MSHSYWSERRKIRKIAREEVSASRAASRLIAAKSSQCSAFADEIEDVDTVPPKIPTVRFPDYCSTSRPIASSSSVKPLGLAGESIPNNTEASNVVEMEQTPMSVPVGVGEVGIGLGQSDESDGATDTDEGDGEIGLRQFLDNIEMRESSAEELSDSDNVSDMDDQTPKTNLAFELLLWATSFGITLAAVSALLAILRVFHPELPKDARTLLKTPRSNTVKSTGNGSYFHFGIFKSLSKSKQLSNFLSEFLPDIPDISLQINIDGLPISKSGSKQLWPILARICKPFSSEPFMVGLYCGVSKPTSLSEYMEDFVFEMENFQRAPVNFNVNGRICPANITLSCFICDTPARSYVKQTKGHCGYFACERCTQKGSYIEGKVIFTEMNAPLRTDNSFNDRRQPEHHTNLGISPLSRLSVNMVSQFPLEYMHLVCLGVTRRLLMFLLRSPVRKGIRLGLNAVRQISQSLDSFKEYLPREFSRKCRNLSEIDRWKATEFRQFLLYSGIVAFRGNLPTDFYEHFLLLFVAIHCLASRRLWQSHADYAHRRLYSFLEKARQLYGRDFIVYNVHNLIHIVDDVKRFGPLDSYSAFPFENFLGQLKRLLRKPQFPLQQIIRRVEERDGMLTRQTKTHLPNNIPKKEHFQGPVPRGILQCLQFQQMFFKGLFFSISRGNNCVRIRDRFYLIRNILLVEGNDRNIIVIEPFLVVTSFFDYPCSSLNFDIVRASRLSGHFDTAYFEDIEHKCVMLPYKNGEYVLLPLEFS